MMLELAVGDAVGAGFEYTSPDFVAKYNNLQGYVKHPRHNGNLGCFSDDTQMSIAIAECLIEKNFTTQNLADKFVSCFKRDERKGYSSRFYNLLKKVNNGQELLEQINPDSDRSGAAMRATPIGILPEIDQVMKYAEIQAKITHNTPLGIMAAQASALAAHYFIWDKGSKDYLVFWLDSILPFEHGPWHQPYKRAVGEKGWMSVHAAVTAIVETDDMASCLKRCIAFTGDVDTVATIALACGSNCKEMKQNLPSNLIDGLENGPYGKDYLIQLDKKLLGSN